jgi:hypothetical protein
MKQLFPLKGLFLTGRFDKKRDKTQTGAESEGRISEGLGSSRKRG